MSTTTALTLLEGVDRDHAARDVTLRTQAAFVRALVDEIDRAHRSGANLVALNDQLDEESDRLTCMLGKDALVSDRA